MDHLDARRQAIARAQVLVAREPCYLDTETTGVRSSAEIIEIAIVDHQGEVLFNSLVRPRLPIPADATSIHGITNAMVADAPDWPTLWPALEPILLGCPIGIFNASFDVRLLAQSNRQVGLPWRDEALESFCIMHLYAQFYGEWDIQRQSYRWQSLDKAQRYCGIPLFNSHRAHADALLARAVLQHIAAATV